jgi:hypothetical protein
MEVLMVFLYRATLNVCIPYASKDEMAFAINRCVQENKGMTHALASDKDAKSSDFDTMISVQDIESNMMLAHSPPLDVLVRTSGVCRLSDFMLWQVRVIWAIAQYGHAHLFFFIPLRALLRSFNLLSDIGPCLGSESWCPSF